MKTSLQILLIVAAFGLIHAVFNPVARFVQSLPNRLYDRLFRKNEAEQLDPEDSTPINPL